jgi:ferric-chelate reductase
MTVFASALFPIRRAEMQSYQHGPEYDGSVVFWTDIFLVISLTISVALLIPQGLARIRSSRDRWQGLFLCGSLHTVQSVQVTYHVNFSDGTRSTADDASTLTLQPSGQSVEAQRVKLTSESPIPHTRSLSSRFRPISNILRLPLPIHGYTLGRGLVPFFYLGVLLFAALYRDSVFKNPTREGAIVASQLPWVYVLGTKNNALGVLVGIGYQNASISICALIDAGLIWWTAQLHSSTCRQAACSLCKYTCNWIQCVQLILYHCLFDISSIQSTNG